jgi:NADPH-dependent curcumin reductase CurA
MRNQQIRIKSLPTDVPTPGDFELLETEAPTPRKGELLCRTRWLSFESFMRALIDSRYFGAMPRVGEVTPARAICEVVESRNEVFNTGDVVVMETGLQNYCVSDGIHVQRVRTGSAPVTTALGVMGLPGLVAYCGLLDLAAIKRGETVLVSVAAGAVGSTVGQIARIQGCKVIGIAGTAEKCEWCVKEAHFNACINYRTESVDQRLRQLAPKGVDVYFDNTGGDLLAMVLERHLSPQGRVVVSALSSQYSRMENPPNTRAPLLQMVVHEHEHRREAFLKDAIAWFAEGHLRYKDDIAEGLQNAAAHFCKLMRRENFGNALVKA